MFIAPGRINETKLRRSEMFIGPRKIERHIQHSAAPERKEKRATRGYKYFAPPERRRPDQFES